MWRSNRGFTVCQVYRHGNNGSSKLFWSIQKDKVGMINNSTPINFISYTDKKMRIEQGWAIISHEGPDLEKLLTPRAAR